MSSDQQQQQKKSRKSIILVACILLLLLIAIIFIKQCGVNDDSNPDNQSGTQTDRTLGVAVPIASLLNPVPEGAGPFATQVSGSGTVYYIHTDPENGEQALHDDTETEIYRFGSSNDRKAWIAGFTDSRVLIYYTAPGINLTDPKEAWNTSQHFSVSPTSTQFGVGPIFHSKKTVADLIESIE